MTKQDQPTASIAILGRILGQGSRRGYKAVTIPISVAKELHDHLKAQRNAAYAKAYKEMRP